MRYLLDGPSVKIYSSNSTLESKKSARLKANIRQDDEPLDAENSQGDDSEESVKV